MRRRDIVKLLLSIPVAGSLLRASLAWAEWNTEAFSAVKSEEGFGIPFREGFGIPFSLLCSQIRSCAGEALSRYEYRGK